ncbi:MAG: histidine phosphatase family protein [Anaerolineae bacterium]|nr:histidine phosphatase family protein [Anaerolineae bacterium]
MKSLFLMRHAKSSWKYADLTDHQRPLNKRGKQDALRVGQFINDEGLAPEVILCSTAHRTRQTVHYLLENCFFDGEIIYRDALYEADIQAYFEQLILLGDEINSAMFVGHNPEISQFLAEICQAYEHFTTAAIAQVCFDVSSWKQLAHDLNGELINFWIPRALP